VRRKCAADASRRCNVAFAIVGIEALMCGIVNLMFA
jgi:hypothetical protein